MYNIQQIDIWWVTNCKSVSCSVASEISAKWLVISFDLREPVWSFPSLVQNLASVLVGLLRSAQGIYNKEVFVLNILVISHDFTKHSRYFVIKQGSFNRFLQYGSKRLL